MQQERSLKPHPSHQLSICREVKDSNWRKMCGTTKQVVADTSYSSTEHISKGYVFYHEFPNEGIIGTVTRKFVGTASLTSVECIMRGLKFQSRKNV